MKIKFVIALILIPIASILNVSVFGQTTSDDWVIQGMDLNDQGKYEEAIESYNRAIDLDPKNAKAWSKKGLAYASNIFGNHKEDAIDCIDVAVNLSRSDADIWIDNGEFLYKIGNFNESINAYKRAIEINSSKSFLWTIIASEFYYLDNYEESLNSYDNAIELDPNNACYWAAKGRLLRNMKRYNESIAAYDRTLELDPEYTSALLSKCGTLEEWGKELNPDAYITVGPGESECWEKYNELEKKVVGEVEWFKYSDAQPGICCEGKPSHRYNSLYHCTHKSFN